ncbi:hypothetical protein BH23CHL2_BH23CHL2_28450 [soil metagenome]
MHSLTINQVLHEHHPTNREGIHLQREAGDVSAETQTETLRIELLGGFRVACGANEIPDDGWRLAKARSLVKIVALAPGQSILREQLVDLLWPELDLDAGSNNLHQALHIARRTLGALLPDEKPNRILRLQRGVLSLEPPAPVWIDVDDFERRARDLQTDDDPSGFYEALDLYRGELLPDDLYEDWAAERRIVLHEQYLSLLDRLARLHVARREATPAIDALRRIVSIEPDREEAHRSLMELYALTGRRQQALRQYERVREILERELDLEPEPETDDLHAAILSGEFPEQPWEAELPAATETGARPEITESIADFLGRAGDFVGRSEELGALQRALERVIGDQGEIILVAGEPGIGKTRISEEFLRYASAQGVRTLWGRCYEGDGAPAYWPWVQVVRSYLDGRSNAELQKVMGPGAADIARIVPELRQRLPDLEDPPPLDPDGERFRLFDSMTTFLKNAAARAPLALIIDDLHSADRSSLLLLEFLAREVAESGLLIIGTYRHVEFDRGHPLTRTLGQLARHEANERITLEGLSVADIDRYIELVTGRETPEGLAGAIHNQSEGNPYFVREIVALLIEEERLNNPEDVRSWRLTIPQGIRETIALRTARLSDTAHRVLTTASVSGRDFELPIIAQVASLDELDTLDALEEALGTGLIVESPPVPGGFRFTHAITRQTLYDDLSQARRLRMHLRTGEAIEQSYAMESAEHLSDLAHHFASAASLGVADKAIDFLSRAGRQAMEQLGHSEATNYFQRALTLMESTDDASLRLEILFLLAEAQMYAGDVVEAREDYELAASVARQNGLIEEFAKAAIGFQACGLYSEPADERAVAFLEEALNLLPEHDSVVRVLVLSRLSRAQYYRRSSGAEGTQLTEAAVESARNLGNSEALGTALIFHLDASWRQMDLAERLRLCDEVADHAHQSGDPQLELAASTWRITAVMEAGNVETADEEISNYLRLATHLRQPQNIWSGMTRQTMRALMSGRFDEATRLTEQALSIGRGCAPGSAQLTDFTHRFLIHYLSTGDVESLCREAREMVQANPQFPFLRCVYGIVLVRSRCETDANKVLEDLMTLVPDELPDNTLRLPTLALVAEIIHEIQTAEHAKRLVDVLQEYEGRNVFGGNSICLGAADHYLGLALRTLGEYRHSYECFENSLASNSHMKAAPFIARDEYAWAQALLASPESEQRLEAKVHIKRALSVARSINMTDLIQQATATLDEQRSSQLCLSN